nr:YhcN/YlaJ family sporulation lipoprotein [Maliibacterium massiliense]
MYDHKTNKRVCLVCALLLALTLCGCACNQNQVQPSASPVPTLSAMPSEGEDILPSTSPQLSPVMSPDASPSQADPSASPSVSPQQSEGVSGAQMPQENSEYSNTVEGLINYQDANWQAQVISNELIQNGHVRTCDVVLLGEKAIVGVAPNTDGESLTESQLRSEVEQRVKLIQPALEQVVVLTNERDVSQLQNMMRGIRAGNDLDGMRSQFEAMIRARTTA